MTNVLIVGAGPAGASTSIFLAKEQVPHMIIDKAIFPRDKVCGDALSAKSVGMLKRLHPDWPSHFLADKTKSIVSSGIRFIAADNTALDIPFLQDDIKSDPPGFVSKRFDFDEQFVSLIDPAYATAMFETSLKDIEETSEGLLVTIVDKGQQKKIFTKMIIGAEGRTS